MPQVAETSRWAALTEAELEAEVERIERVLDRLEDATWPAASRERADVLDRLAAVRAEVERRRT